MGRHAVAVLVTGNRYRVPIMRAVEQDAGAIIEVAASQDELERFGL